MSVTINDLNLLSQLLTGDPVELIDPTGRLLGTFIPDDLCESPTVVETRTLGGRDGQAAQADH
jgi:hypothetical protein